MYHYPIPEPPLEPPEPMKQRPERDPDEEYDDWRIEQLETLRNRQGD